VSCYASTDISDVLSMTVIASSQNGFAKITGSFSYRSSVRKAMVRRGQRRIRSKTAWAMCTWSHYRFRQHLLHKAREHPWCKVIICTEEYTSKTCGSCGHLHQGLGGSKVFRCPVCRTELDRDINGARNILLRYLTIKYNERAGAGAYSLTGLVFTFLGLHRNVWFD